MDTNNSQFWADGCPSLILHVNACKYADFTINANSRRVHGNRFLDFALASADVSCAAAYATYYWQRYFVGVVVNWIYLKAVSMMVCLLHRVQTWGNVVMACFVGQA